MCCDIISSSCNVTGWHRALTALGVLFAGRIQVWKHHEVFRSDVTISCMTGEGWKTETKNVIWSIFHGAVFNYKMETDLMWDWLHLHVICETRPAWCHGQLVDCWAYFDTNPCTSERHCLIVSITLSVRSSILFSSVLYSLRTFVLMILVIDNAAVRASN